MDFLKRFQLHPKNPIKHILIHTYKFVTVHFCMEHACVCYAYTCIVYMIDTAVRGLSGSNVWANNVP